MISFDGTTKLITLSGDTSFTDKAIYDASVDWAVLEDNMQYLLPMDFVSPNYRLLNGWKLQADGYDEGELVTVNGSVIAVSGSRVASGQCVEWDIGTTINTVFIASGSGLSTEEHDKLMNVDSSVADEVMSRDVVTNETLEDTLIAFN